MSFSQCASTKKLQDSVPESMDKVYYQSWVAGVKGGGSGINIIVETKGNIDLEQVYFRGQIADFETKPNSKLHIGRFVTEGNRETSMTQTTENQDFPFDLSKNDCVISYSENGKVKYFKIENLEEKPMETLPMSAPPNKG